MRLGDLSLSLCLWSVWEEKPEEESLKGEEVGGGGVEDKMKGTARRVKINTRLEERGWDTNGRRKWSLEYWVKRGEHFLCCTLCM